MPHCLNNEGFISAGKNLAESELGVRSLFITFCLTKRVKSTCQRRGKRRVICDARLDPTYVRKQSTVPIFNVLG